jgi:hypothetical protein
VVDGAHGFRVVKILSGLWFQMHIFWGCRSKNSDASLYLKLWYSFYIRVEYQRLHENNLARRAQLMCIVGRTIGDRVRVGLSLVR